MKRAFLFAAFAVGLTGCAHGQIVVAPDGQPATYVTCHQQEKCFVKAHRLCPYGFQVLDAPYGSLLFRCGPPYPDAPPPNQEEQAPAPPSMAPSQTTPGTLYRT